MFYPRNIKRKAPNRKNFKINAFGGYRTGVAENLVDLSESKYCFNFVARDGELTHGTGTNCAKLKKEDGTYYVLPRPSENVIGAWYYNRIEGDKLIVQTVSGTVYSLAVQDYAREYINLGNTTGKIFSAVNYRLSEADVLLLSCENGMFYIQENDLIRVSDTPRVKELCIHSERAFASVQEDGSLLRFSKVLDPLDWSEGQNAGGYVYLTTFGGKIKKVLSFGGYLYIFREYSVERLIAYGDETEFSIKNVYQSTDRIYENTVCACGDVIMFLSEKGLNAFDGATVRFLNNVVESKDANQAHGSVATYYQGVYYLGTRLGWLDEEESGDRYEYFINNCILAYDTVTGRVNIMADYDAYGFCVINTEYNSTLMLWVNPQTQIPIERLGVLCFDKCVRFDSGTDMYWRTGMTDLGYPEKRKFLRSINMTVRAGTVVGVILDEEKIEFNNVFGTQVRLRINREFKKFGLYIRTFGKIQRIGNPVITVDMR